MRSHPVDEIHGNIVLILIFNVQLANNFNNHILLMCLRITAAGNRYRVEPCRIVAARTIN